MFEVSTLLSTFGLAGIYAIVFMETGLLIGFIFPGDTLLFTAGIMASAPEPFAPLWALMLGIPISAIIGDQVGYTIGKRVGPAIMRTRVAQWIGPEYIDKTNHFFDIINLTHTYDYFSLWLSYSSNCPLSCPSKYRFNS